MTATSEFAAALCDRTRPAPAGLATWNGSDPAQRFSIYRNNVAVALIDALAATFPVTRALCGEAFFRDMARQFALCAPPASPLLAEFGQDFPAFIAAYERARPVAYLADVAKLEAARARVWHAADAEPLAHERLSCLGSAIGAATFVLHPAHATLVSPFAIVSIWAAHNGVGDLGELDVDVPEEALIVRPRLDVEIWRLPRSGAAFIGRLGMGVPVAEAAMATLADVPSFDPGAALHVLVAARLVAGILEGDPM